MVQGNKCPKVQSLPGKDCTFLYPRLYFETL
jgi:hypothetical protein